MKQILYLLLVIVFTSCNGRTDSDEHGAQIKLLGGTEFYFSKMSEEKGMKEAFLHYMDSDAVLLRPNHYPIIGSKAKQYLEESNDSSFTLTWIAADVIVSSSHDLGYTYGTYKLFMKDTTLKGTYLTIWKKQGDGSWKFTLDTGNPGLEKK